MDPQKLRLIILISNMVAWIVLAVWITMVAPADQHKFLLPIIVLLFIVENIALQMILRRHENNNQRRS